MTEACPAKDLEAAVTAADLDQSLREKKEVPDLRENEMTRPANPGVILATVDDLAPQQKNPAADHDHVRNENDPDPLKNRDDLALP